MVFKTISRFLSRGWPFHRDPLRKAQKAHQKFADSKNKESVKAQGHIAIAMQAYASVVDSCLAKGSDPVRLRICLNNLATATWDSYKHPGTTPNNDPNILNARLQRVIDLYTEASQLPHAEEEAHDMLAVPIVNLANAHLERFDKSGNGADIEATIRYYVQASRFLPQISPAFIEIDMEIGLAYWTWCNRIENGNITISHDSILYFERACNECILQNKFHDIQTTCSYTLGLAYYQWYQRNTEIASRKTFLDKSIDFYTLALNTMSQEDGRHTNALFGISTALFCRYINFGADQIDLQRAKEEAQKTLNHSESLPEELRNHMSRIVCYNPNGPHESSQDESLSSPTSTYSAFYTARESFASVSDPLQMVEGPSQESQQNNTPGVRSRSQPRLHIQSHGVGEQPDSEHITSRTGPSASPQSNPPSSFSMGSGSPRNRNRQRQAPSKTGSLPSPHSPTTPSTPIVGASR